VTRHRRDPETTASETGRPVVAAAALRYLVEIVSATSVPAGRFVPFAGEEASTRPGFFFFPTAQFALVSRLRAVASVWPTSARHDAHSPGRSRVVLR
jgi:hypothetical protein